MKYLAILKDSFRETLDSKLLYVTLALSGILLFVVGSVKFHPLSLREQLDGVAWIYGLAFGQQGSVTCEVVEVAQTNDAPEPRRGDYRFTLMLRFAGEDQANSDGVNKQHQLEFFVREVCWWLEKVETRRVPNTPKNEVHVEFTSRGTKIANAESWLHEPQLFFGAVPTGPLFRNSLSYWVYFIENRLVNTIGAWVAVLIGIVVTASFIPNMLHKGTVDLLLAKPIRRPTLLAFKFLGGLTFVFVNAAVTIVGVWLLLGLRTGIWAPGFLLCTFVITFFFAVLYAISTLIGVLTRSTVICIVLTCLAWFLFWLVGFVHGILNAPDSPSEARMRRAQAMGKKIEDEPAAPKVGAGNLEWVKTTVGVLHRVVPRTSDLGRLTTQFLSTELLSQAERQQLEIARDLSFTWTESIGVCCAYIMVMLGLACWRFARKDY